MTLFIDTTDFNKMTFGLEDNGKIKQKSFKIDSHKSHETLQKLDEFLRESKISNLKSGIRKIVVNKGPGSYTGTRVGVTIGQALSLAWQVPVKFVSASQFKIADTRIGNR
ncbi:MAG: hypothetical protein HY918_04930 [Candidatus Doudnabacteria bacterium]|nr:hypothetical protein [Candidatus Doudnabacteria bacterium]